MPEPYIALNRFPAKSLDVGDPVDAHALAVETLLDATDELILLIGKDRTRRLVGQCWDALW